MAENIRLSELTAQVKEHLQAHFLQPVMVTAEISEMQESRGNAYWELIEKNEDGEILAKCRAVVWSHTYRMLKPYFETSTGQHLRSGLQVLISVQPGFHEVYGFSLNVKDIEPAYTLGEIEQSRQLLIARLKEEGIFDMNKETILPEIPQRIAVISSSTAAGYGDFTNQLKNNPYGFRFDTVLFKSAMQGEDTEREVVAALEAIYRSDINFDLVVIIRGGGSKSDLSWFDSYEIAAHIAQFPLPVFTGIGHERDRSVADLVAHTSLKTPTAVAEFLINRLLHFDGYLEDLKNELFRLTKNYVEKEEMRLAGVEKLLLPLTEQSLLREKHKIERPLLQLKHILSEKVHKHSLALSVYEEQLKLMPKKILDAKNQELINYLQKLEDELKYYLQNKNRILQTYTKAVELQNPALLLKKGYSLTLCEGRLIKSPEDLQKGDRLLTLLHGGKLYSSFEDSVPGEITNFEET